MERIEIDGKIYRKQALTGIKEVEAPTGMESGAVDFFYAWIPEDRFGTERLTKIGKVQDAT